MADDLGEPGKRRKNPSADTDLSRRLDRLSRDLEAERREHAAKEQPQDRRAGDYGQAFKLASEFVAGVLAGAALGWGLDQIAGTSPWGLIVLLLLGFCAGTLNVVRAARRISQEAATKRADDDVSL